MHDFLARQFFMRVFAIQKTKRLVFFLLLGSAGILANLFYICLQLANPY